MLMKPLRLLVVDDNDLARTKLCSLFACEEEIELVGQGRNGEEAVLQNQVLRPDIVVMDIKMPGMDGIEATKAIKQSNPDAKVVICSAYDDEEHRVKAKAAGAGAYFLKGDPVEDLIRDIKSAKK